MQKLLFNKRHLFSAFMALILVTVTGCANTPGPNSYTQNEAMSAGKVVEAKVLDVRTVKIQSNAQTGSGGSLAGAVVGGIAGNSIGAGHGNALMTVGGVILGSILGDTVENKASAQKALQIILKTKRGRVLSIVQPASLNVSKGEPVWLIRYYTENGERYRVEPRGQ